MPCSASFPSLGFTTLPGASAGRCSAAPTRGAPAQGLWWDIAHIPTEAVPAASLPGLSGAGAQGLPRGCSTVLTSRSSPRTTCPPAPANKHISPGGSGRDRLCRAHAPELSLPACCPSHFSLSLQEEQAQRGGAAGTVSSCHSHSYNRWPVDNHHQVIKHCQEEPFTPASHLASWNPAERQGEDCCPAGAQGGLPQPSAQTKSPPSSGT